MPISGKSYNSGLFIFDRVLWLNPKEKKYVVIVKGSGCDPACTLYVGHVHLFMYVAIKSLLLLLLLIVATSLLFSRSC